MSRARGSLCGGNVPGRSGTAGVAAAERVRRGKGSDMSRFEVDSAQVLQASTAVQSSAQQIATEVDRMMRHLLDLQNCWKGQAATSFQEVVTQWRSTQERVRLALEDVQRALAVAGRNYADAEEAAARMFAP